MFGRKRVSVAIGDVFVETLPGKKKSSNPWALPIARPPRPSSRSGPSPRLSNLMGSTMPNWSTKKADKFEQLRWTHWNGKRFTSKKREANPVRGHRAKRASIASQIITAISGPPKAFISRMQVGEVTLISVR